MSDARGWGGGLLCWRALVRSARTLANHLNITWARYRGYIYSNVMRVLDKLHANRFSVRVCATQQVVGFGYMLCFFFVRVCKLVQPDGGDYKEP